MKTVVWNGVGDRRWRCPGIRGSESRPAGGASHCAQDRPKRPGFSPAGFPDRCGRAPYGAFDTREGALIKGELPTAVSDG